MAQAAQTTETPTQVPTAEDRRALEQLKLATSHEDEARHAKGDKQRLLFRFKALSALEEATGTFFNNENALVSPAVRYELQTKTIRLLHSLKEFDRALEVSQNLAKEDFVKSDPLRLRDVRALIIQSSVGTHPRQVGEAAFKKTWDELEKIPAAANDKERLEHLKFLEKTLDGCFHHQTLRRRFGNFFGIDEKSKVLELLILDGERKEKAASRAK